MCEWCGRPGEWVGEGSTPKQYACTRHIHKLEGEPRELAPTPEGDNIRLVERLRRASDREGVDLAELLTDEECAEFAALVDEHGKASDAEFLWWLHMTARLEERLSTLLEVRRLLGSS